DAYAAGVTAVAAPGARLLMFGVGRAPVPGAGVTKEELRHRFAGWRLVSAVRMTAEELRGYIRTGRVFEAAMARRWFDVWRYRWELGASPSGSGPSQRDVIQARGMTGARPGLEGSSGFPPPALQGRDGRSPATGTSGSDRLLVIR